jgi:taurine dioxygenase
MKFRKIAGALGAEVTGIDLTQGLTSDLVKDIRDIFLNHNVIFLKNQPHSINFIYRDTV